MQRFLRIFRNKQCNIIGMIHVDALPGTPKYVGKWAQTLEKACYEAHTYANYKLDAVLVENMHDVPYVQSHELGPETVACMTRLCHAVRQLLPQEIPCGVQVLACGNKQALAVAKACDLQFVRIEGYIFGHIADEGYTNACAGGLLRYRRQIDADEVLVFTDIKKKHSAHAITQDVNLLETAKTAELFLTDGVIITGNSTGHAANPNDLAVLAGKVKCPLLIGSGVTRNNLKDYYSQAHGVIIGSHFKVDGEWQKDLCEPTISAFMEKATELRTSQKS